MEALKEYSPSDEEDNINVSREEFDPHSLEKTSSPLASSKQSSSHLPKSRSNSPPPKIMPHSPSPRDGSPSPPLKRSSHSPPQEKRSRSRSLSPKARSHSPPLRGRSRSPPQRKRSRSPPQRKRSRSPPRRGRSRSPPPQEKSHPSHSRRDRFSGHSRQTSHYDRRRGSRDHSPPRHSESHRHHRHRSPPYHSSHSRSQRQGGSDRDRFYEERRHSKLETKDTKESTSEQKIPKPIWSDDSSLTPEEKLEQALTAARALAPKVLPEYMNPGAMNPKQFQNIQAKRKMLWSKSKSKQTGQSWNKWESASFEKDDGGQTQSKFRRLMGIKDNTPTDGGTTGGGETTTSATQDSSKVTGRNTNLLNALEAQYETSRFMTHLAKGAGLGYGIAAQITQKKVDPHDTDNL